MSKIEMLQFNKIYEIECKILWNQDNYYHYDVPIILNYSSVWKLQTIAINDV